MKNKKFMFQKFNPINEKENLKKKKMKYYNIYSLSIHFQMLMRSFSFSPFFSSFVFLLYTHIGYKMFRKKNDDGSSDKNFQILKQVLNEEKIFLMSSRRCFFFYKNFIVQQTFKLRTKKF